MDIYNFSQLPKEPKDIFPTRKNTTTTKKLKVYLHYEYLIIKYSLQKKNTMKYNINKGIHKCDLNEESTTFFCC